MKTNNHIKHMSLAALKQQRHTLDKQNMALYIGMMAMTIVMTVVLCLNLSQTATDVILTISAIAMEVILPVSFYKIVKRAWTINDIDRETRRIALAHENGA